jgi:hypothetical protein
MKATLVAGALAAGGVLFASGAARLSAQTPEGPAAPPSAATATAPATSATDHAAFSGTWKLNAEESENFRDKMRAAHQGGGGHGSGGGGGHGGGGMGGGGGHWGGGGHYGGGRSGGGGMSDGSGASDDTRQTMQRLDEPPESLTIKQEQGAFLIGDDSGQIRHLLPDGKAAKTESGDEVKTRWQGDQLVTETTPAHGPHLKETFALSADGKKLYVTTHFEPRWGGAVDVRRVYDAASLS